MRLSILIFVLVIFIQPVISQTKQLTIDDAIIGRYTKYNPDYISGLHWRNENSYVLIENDTLYQCSVKKDQKTKLLSLKEIQNAAEKISVEIKSFPAFRFQDENTILIKYGLDILVFNLTENEFTLNLKIPDDSKFLDFCDANNTLTYTKGQNLFILDQSGEKQITFDTDAGIVNGQYVHRREFGITKGTFWSPDGYYLAFYRKDESMVKDYPLVDFMAREAEHTPVKYPMAGMKSHHVTLGIYNLKSGETVFMQTGEPKEHYLTNISWGPNEAYIYIAELNRDQNHMHLNQYKVADGSFSKTLIEEKSNTYVEPEHPIIFSKKNPEQFYYQTRNDGWSHLYIYNVYGKKIKQLTKGDWEVTNFYGYDEAEKNIFIQSTKENPTERHIYKVEIKSGELTKLSKTEGTHTASFSNDFSYLIDNWTAFDVPHKTDLISSNGKLIKNVLTSENKASDIQFGENKIFTIKSEDNKTDLYCRMILPPNFDSTRKYPVIVYVYGGPHAQLVNNTWHNDAGWWQYYMASKGYIAFTLDNRGSANRGKAFEDIIHRNLGINETADQMKGIEYLKSLPYVDTNRIGVHGWSYGGFMTLNLMLRQPETFKVGVAGGPVVDWEMYEVMYGERYMDHPDDNPDGYKSSNMINHVGNLNGKLMLIHGVQDETVVTQHSMKFLRECVKQNKQVDFFAYPIHPHNVRGKDRIHLMDKVSQYFIDYL
ncbi:S9 family peptidase [Sunxiuqinia sp. A32]|uniref:S9 family peptidase n=1 Tax=Sunxiuqinia sp. A32 TaxID=3461496 RepID=UPI00404645E5